MAVTLMQPKFQFLIVQLKDCPKNVIYHTLLFQFLIVQLKALLQWMQKAQSNVSIPYSTIKSIYI